MASLAQLLASHGCILVLDASSASVHIGLLRAGQAPVWHSEQGDAGRTLFTGVSTCLQTAGLDLDRVPAFAFCEGPGSMLGIRTAAMALRTWLAARPRPVYRYQSLTLLAHGLRAAGHALPFSVIADARRETWHTVAVTADGPAPLRRVPSTDLAAGNDPLFQPPAFRAWAPPPRPTTPCPYDAPALLAAHADEPGLFAPTETPDAFQHEAPEYKKWSAIVHSAVTAPPR